MTAGLMRRLFSSLTRAQLPSRLTWNRLTAPRLLGLEQHQRCFTVIQPLRASVSLSRTWFTSSSACPSPEGRGNQPPDERTLKLGKTIRILHERLPTLLTSPLPQDILSPRITLHLFPSTHPHLPTVSGKLAYTAALWTAPVAWGKVPVLGNVELVILSERMVKNGGTCEAGDSRHEKLIVKWKTCGKPEKKHGQGSEVMDKISQIIRGPSSSPHDEEFSGLFLFEFDEEGRILKHTIEHAEENGSWDRTTKVISVTDWLLGRTWGRRGEEGTPSLAFARCTEPPKRRRDLEKRGK